MRKVKYIPATHLAYSRLTIGKVYDVISYEYDLKLNCNIIYIRNDEGVTDWYFASIHNDVSVFIDVTHEYRNDVINEILE